LVERNLAKVEVAGSNPVVRSERVGRPAFSLVEWPRGEATACKAVYTGSNPVSTSTTPSKTWAIGAAVARFPDTEEVTGSIPVSPTQHKAPPPIRGEEPWSFRILSALEARTDANHQRCDRWGWWGSWESAPPGEVIRDTWDPLYEVAPECATVSSRAKETRRNADVAQLVERNLAKVEVAGSNPVVRSDEVSRLSSAVEWPRGEATACKAVYAGSNPVSTSTPFEDLGDWRSGSALP
jgi:hypothetical protein